MQISQDLSSPLFGIACGEGRGGGGEAALLFVCANDLIPYFSNRDTLQVSWIIGVSIDVKN